MRYEELIKSVPLKIVGSSKFGRYPKISIEKTYNMFESDNCMVPYPGYKVGIPASKFDDAEQARAIFASEKFNRIVGVFDKNVYLMDIDYNQQFNRIDFSQVTIIGSLQTTTGKVYISENNKPQLCFSDGQNIYIYDPSYTGAQYPFTVNTGTSTSELNYTGSPTFAVGDRVTLVSGTGGTLPTGLSESKGYYISTTSDFASNELFLCPTYSDAVNAANIVTFSTNGTPPNSIVTRGTFSTVKINFTPRNIIFHDTYFIVAAQNDTSQGGVLNNTWRLSLPNNGTQFPSDAQHVGLLETKPDKTMAIARIPSAGNLIFVMGQNVVEPWFNEGAQLFPYQRNNQYNSDYGCVSTDTVCSLDNLVVWLARNEKSGPIIMMSTGTLPEKITTDGLDFLFSQFQSPEDSEAFLYRQDGHLIYHINFYTDNQSFFYDFNTKQFYNACDFNNNYYSMGQVVFYKNQYYSISKDNGNFYIFDTVFYTYDNVKKDGTISVKEIPRIRITEQLRDPSQNYFIINDVGFTIESGETDYIYQNRGPIYLGTISGNYLVTMGSTLYLGTMDGNTLTTISGDILIGTQQDTKDPDFLVATQDDIVPVTPRVDLSISYDGGATFGNEFSYELMPVGRRINKLQWWQLGMSNNAVLQFKFWNMGRVVITDGVVNTR